MKLKKDIRVLGSLETYRGKKADCNIAIILSAVNSDKPWYFVISHVNRIFSYNSSWEHDMFSSKVECLNAAIAKLNEFIKVNFLNEYDNVHNSHI